MQKHSKLLIRFLTLTLALTLFSNPVLAFPKASATPDPTPAAADPAAATANPTAPAITKGTVVETMDSGGYTYLCIENAGQKRWAAVPATEVKVGQEVELAPGMEMGKFTSKSLGRTFESIYFCSGLANAPGKLPHPVPEAGQTGMPPGHGTTPAGMPPGHGTAAAAKPAAELPPAATIAGKITETFDAGGYTYAAVENSGQNTWVASPPAKLAVGQEVAFVSGFVMKNFTSKSLDRTFDAIVFSSGLANPAAAAAEGSAGK